MFRLLLLALVAFAIGEELICRQGKIAKRKFGRPTTTAPEMTTVTGTSGETTTAGPQLGKRAAPVDPSNLTVVEGVNTTGDPTTTIIPGEAGAENTTISLDAPTTTPVPGVPGTGNAKTTPDATDTSTDTTMTDTTMTDTTILTTTDDGWDWEILENNTFVDECAMNKGLNIISMDLIQGERNATITIYGCTTEAHCKKFKMDEKCGDLRGTLTREFSGAIVVERGIGCCRNYSYEESDYP